MIGPVVQECDCKSDGCGFDFHLRNIFDILFVSVTRQTAALTSATQLDEKWETKVS